MKVMSRALVFQGFRNLIREEGRHWIWIGGRSNGLPYYRKTRYTSSASPHIARYELVTQQKLELRRGRPAWVKLCLEEDCVACWTPVPISSSSLSFRPKKKRDRLPKDPSAPRKGSSGWKQTLREWAETRKQDSKTVAGQQEETVCPAPSGTSCNFRPERDNAKRVLLTTYSG